jgi:hypothetical protein
MAYGKPNAYLDFSGGLNLEAGPYVLKDNECQDCRDVHANKEGSLVKRNGSTRTGTYGNINTTLNGAINAAVTTITVTSTTGAAASGYILIDNEKIQYASKTSTTFAGCTRASLSTTAAAHSNGAMVTALNGAILSAHTLFATTGVFQGFIGVGPVSPGAAEDSIVKIATDGTTTTLETGLTANKPWEWVQGPLATDETPAQGPYYGINGIDTPQYWDGVAANTLEWTASDADGVAISPHPAKTAKYLVYHLDKFWASGCDDCQGRIWSTGVNGDNPGLPDPCNWDSDFIDDVEPFDGQGITGLGTVGPYLLVFKQRKAYVLSDPFNRNYRRLSSSIGCASHRSIVETTQGTLFLSEDLGVCITDGSNIQVVSDKIQPLLDQMAHTNPQALNKAVGTYLHDSYWLSIPYGDVKNSITLQYQLDTGAWWVHSFASADYATLEINNAKRVHAALPEVAGMNELLVANVYSDNDVPYQSYWEGPYWTWGTPHMNKRVNQYRIDGLGVWQVEAATTFNDDTPEVLDYVQWETGSSAGADFGGAGENFGGAGFFVSSDAMVTQMRYYTPTEGWGRAWSLKLSDPNNVNAMAIYSITGFLRPRSD